MLELENRTEAISERTRVEVHGHIDAAEIERLSSIALYEVARMPLIARKRARDLFGKAIDEAFDEHSRTRRRFELCLDERIEEARDILKQEFKGQGDFRSEREKAKHNSRVRLWTAISVLVGIPLFLVAMYACGVMYLASRHANLC